MCNTPYYINIISATQNFVKSILSFSVMMDLCVLIYQLSVMSCWFCEKEQHGAALFYYWGMSL